MVHLDGAVILFFWGIPLGLALQAVIVDCTIISLEYHNGIESHHSHR